MSKKTILQSVMALATVYLLGSAAVRFMDFQVKQNVSVMANSSENWGLGFGEAGQKPTGNKTADELKEYNAHYLKESTDKIIYLTFDAGYENGNTAPILDALAKHEVKATFFVVGNYLETSPELVKRMVEEGHTVANHTYHHRDMSSMLNKGAFEKELVESGRKKI